jgi:hypothetical protein
VVKTRLSRIVPNWQLEEQLFSTVGVESTKETSMKQMFLTLWVAACVLRLPAAAADSTNASTGISTAESISEIISLKHAGASDVAEALNYLSGRGHHEGSGGRAQQFAAGFRQPIGPGIDPANRRKTGRDAEANLD